MRRPMHQIHASRSGGRGKAARGVALATASLLCLFLLTTPGHAAVLGASTAVSLQSMMNPVMLGGFPPAPPIIIPQVQPPRSPFQPPSWVPKPIPLPSKPSWVPGPPSWVGK